MDVGIGCEFYAPGSAQTGSCGSLDQAVSTDDSLTYPRTSLVIRLRTRLPQANRRTLSDLRTKQAPSTPALVRYSPIIKPKSSKLHSRRCSSGVRASGTHFDFPTAMECPGKHSGEMHRFPTMLVLRLMKRKLKRKETQVTPSPSLKYVNLQCPAVFSEKPKRPSQILRQPKTNSHRTRASAYTNETPELLSIRQLTAQPVQNTSRPYSPLVARTEATEDESAKSRRKVVFTRRENQDPYYDLSLGSYYV